MSTLAIPAVSAPTFRTRFWAPWTIFAADIFAVEFSLWLGLFARLMLRPWFPAVIGPAQFRGVILGVLTMPLAYYLVGLYPGYGMSAVERLRARVFATCTVFSVLILWNYLAEAHPWSRGIMVAAMGFTLLLSPLTEELVRNTLREQNWCGMPVIVLGAGRTGMLLIQRLRQESSLGLVPIAAFDDDPRKWNTQMDGVPVLGPLSAASEMAGQCSTAMVAMPGLKRARLASLLHHLNFPQVVVIPDLIGVQSLGVSTMDFGGLLGLQLKKNLLLRSNRIVKRLADYGASLPLFLISLPLLGLFAALIKMVSPGPAFYRQEREGFGGRTITIWKLRTMYPNAERLLEDYLERNPHERDNWHRFYKLHRDPRVLPGIGQFLRQSSLDELPQLWNILRGDMSLIGPRPFPRYHLDSFSDEFRRMRCSVMPGLTGLWQVSARSDGDLETQEAQDTYYIRNWSLWLDLHILTRTAGVVLLKKGAY